MKKILIPSIISTLLLINGCSSSAPKCDDSDVIDKVKSLYQKILVKIEEKQILNLYIDSAVKDSSNNQGELSCSAKITAINDLNGKVVVNKATITYKILKNNSGSTSINLTALGESAEEPL